MDVVYFTSLHFTHYLLTHVRFSKRSVQDIRLLVRTYIHTCIHAYKVQSVTLNWLTFQFEGIDLMSRTEEGQKYDNSICGCLWTAPAP